MPLPHLAAAAAAGDDAVCAVASSASATALAAAAFATCAFTPAPRGLSFLCASLHPLFLPLSVISPLTFPLPSIPSLVGASLLDCIPSFFLFHSPCLQHSLLSFSFPPPTSVISSSVHPYIFSNLAFVAQARSLVLALPIFL